jgi:uncharacterized membrane protein
MNMMFIKALLFCFIVGIVLPFLISSDDWVLFGLGVLLLLSSIYYLARVVKSVILDKGDSNDQGS